MQGDVQLVHEADGWRVEVEGEPHSVHQFRIDAVVVAHETARRLQRDLVIHGRDGAARELVSYSEEPPEDSDPPRKPLRRRRPELRRA